MIAPWIRSARFLLGTACILILVSPVLAEDEPKAPSQPVAGDGSVITSPAQTGAPPPPPQPATDEPTPLTKIAEVGGGYGWFSDDFESGRGAFARVSFIRPDDYTWRIETYWGERFGLDGKTIGATYIHSFRNKVSLSLGAATGDGPLAPEYRFDVSVQRPFLKKDNLLLSFGVKEEQSNFENSSRGVNVGMVYYFPKYWILQSNARYDRGQPGGTDSTGIGAALTWGLYKRIYVVAGFDYGDASYEVVSEGGVPNVLVDLKGRSYSLALIRYVKPKWGFTLRGEYGSNNVYSGSGVQFSIFKEWN